MDVVELLAAAQFVNHVVDKREQLEDQIANGNLRLLTEVDQLAVQAPADCSPLVFLNERAPIKTKAHIHPIELGKFRDYRLNERGERNDFVDSRRYVTDAKLQGRECRVRADIPPYLLRFVDAPCLEEKIDVVVELRIGAEVIGNVGSREFLEDLRAIALQPGP